MRGFISFGKFDRTLITNIIEIQTIDTNLLTLIFEGYPIFQTEVHEPYPELNGGQIRRARGLSVPNRYINAPHIAGLEPGFKG